MVVQCRCIAILKDDKLIEMMILYFQIKELLARVSTQCVEFMKRRDIIPNTAKGANETGEALVTKQGGWVEDGPSVFINDSSLNQTAANISWGSHYGQLIYS